MGKIVKRDPLRALIEEAQAALIGNERLPKWWQARKVKKLRKELCDCGGSLLCETSVPAFVGFVGALFLFNVACMLLLKMALVTTGIRDKNIFLLACAVSTSVVWIGGMDFLPNWQSVLFHLKKASALPSDEKQLIAAYLAGQFKDIQARLTGPESKLFALKASFDERGRDARTLGEKGMAIIRLTEEQAFGDRIERMEGLVETAWRAAEKFEAARDKVGAKIAEIDGVLAAAEERAKREIISSFDELGFAREVEALHGASGRSERQAEEACAESSEVLRASIKELHAKLIPAFNQAAGEIFARGEPETLDHDLAALDSVLERGQNLLVLPSHTTNA